MKFYILFLFLVFSVGIYGQDSLVTAPNITKDTKFGLALSGGGAKGFAHIGILKTLDSLGIKVDYITGTSMGGILGGLYAMGYSGKELKSKVYSTDWKRVLSNKIPYNKVNISEKDEYNKYIIEFPVIHGMPSLPSSFIEGQYMSEVLNTLTFPAKNINDFHQPPIPVELTSSDIVNGGLVMQKEGSLPLAIRSTLAIPAAFAPVYINGRLLVDGGLDRNFPVQEVKNMGAQYIIGGYTGFRLFTKEEIENPMKMIYQTHAFRSVEDFNHQKEMSNILVDFVSPLNNYTTKDFKNYKEIIKIGEQTAKKHLPEFIALAKAQREAGITYEHKLIEEVKLPTIQFTYSEDNGTPLDNPSEVESIQKLMNLEAGKYYDAETVNAAIDRVFGMRQYERVYYTYTRADNGLIMNIFIKRNRSAAFKLALHYDNEQSVGIIVNYTYRDYTKAKLRALATVDIAERLKARLQFQKFLDNGLRWWISTEGSISHLKNNDLLLRVAQAGIDTINNIYIPEHIYRSINVNTAINYSVSPNAMAAIGVEFNSERIYRLLDKIGQAVTSFYDKRIYQHTNFDLFFKFNQNSFNKRFYPSSGNNLMFITKYYWGDRYNLYDLEKMQPNLYDYLTPDFQDYVTPRNLISLTVNENYVQPVTTRFSIKANAFLGAQFSPQKISPEETPYLFINQRYNLGGSEYNTGGYSPEFNGFRQREILAGSAAKVGIDFQYQLLNNLYITPSIQYASVSDVLSPFKDSVNILGYGLNLGYESILGPINFNISKNNYTDIWRAYFSIGFKF